MSKCCANCFWCFNDEDEEELEGYSEDDLNRPQAGDCCIGQECDENYCCPHHSYIDGMEEYENYVLYDDKYLGPGYLIVSKLDDEVVKFMKISLFDEGGFPSFFIRTYEKDNIDNPDEEFREISFEIKQGECLYDIVYNFGLSLAGDCITSINSTVQGRNNLSVVFDKDSVSLVFAKDVYGVKNSTDFVDISVGDNYSCDKYEQISKFCNNLSTIAVGKAKNEDIKKLLKNKI